MINKLTYPIKRTYYRVKRVIDFIPIIWSGFDFDYSYSIELFKYQLERQADFMESDRAMTKNASSHAKKIRTAVRLIEKVYEKEEYETEYQDKLKEKYGENVLNCNWVPLSEEDKKEIPEDWGYDLVSHQWEYETWNNVKEIEKDKDKWFKESQEKQERAEKLLWDFIAHNIRGWWD